MGPLPRFLIGQQHNGIKVQDVIENGLTDSCYGKLVIGVETTMTIEQSVKGIRTLPRHGIRKTFCSTSEYPLLLDS